MELNFRAVTSYTDFQLLVGTIIKFITMTAICDLSAKKAQVVTGMNNSDSLSHEVGTPWKKKKKT
jgi:hypothetical protein